MQQLTGFNNVFGNNNRPITISIICVLLTLSAFLYSCRNRHTTPAVDDITKNFASLKAADGYSEGKKIFSNLCLNCHPAPERNITCQYTFDELFTRLPDPAEKYFVSYISDTRKLIASGNKYAKAVHEQYNNTYEHHFKDSLSPKQFTSLITYIKIAARLK